MVYVIKRMGSVVVMLDGMVMIVQFLLILPVQTTVQVMVSALVMMAVFVSLDGEIVIVQFLV